MKKVVHALLLSLALALSLPPVSVAEYVLDPALEQEAQWVFGQVLSPFCPGKLLRDCPSRAASSLKEDIRKKIDEGKSREAVIEELYLLYGEDISAVPRTAGFGLVAWVTPGLFVLLGFLGLLYWLRARKGNHASDSTPLSDSDTKSHISPEVAQEIDKLINE